MRDLFQHDDGGWLQDPALLDRLVADKLQAKAESLRDEGWKWIAVATDFPYGHSAGLRRLVGETAELNEEEAASFEALRTARPPGRCPSILPTTWGCDRHAHQAYIPPAGRSRR